jgi:hypothetical protein
VIAPYRNRPPLRLGASQEYRTAEANVKYDVDSLSRFGNNDKMIQRYADELDPRHAPMTTFPQSRNGAVHAPGAPADDMSLPLRALPWFKRGESNSERGKHG